MSIATANRTAPSPVVSKPLRVLAWLSLIAETLIIATGGAVRLTGSGLGCSEWPMCTPESLVPTPEQGIHGIIEFGNRTMTGVVLALALVVLLLTVRAFGPRGALRLTLILAGVSIVVGVAVALIVSAFGVSGFPYFSAGLLAVVIVAAVMVTRRITERRDLVVLAWLVLIGVIAQAFVGGITVLTGLNPFIVGFHYASSLVLVCITAAYIVRMHESAGPRTRVGPVWFAILAHVTGLALATTIVFGVLTTGSGPHSGDANVIRDGFDASVLAHVHSWPGYILAGLVAVLVAGSWALRLPSRVWTLVLAALVIVQVIVGVWQAREGLPELLVGTHMVLAAVSAAAYTVVVLRIKRPQVAATDPRR